MRRGRTGRGPIATAPDPASRTSLTTGEPEAPSGLQPEPAPPTAPEPTRAEPAEPLRAEPAEPPRAEPAEPPRAEPAEPPRAEPSTETDDLTRIEGVGPKISSALVAAGISSYAAVAAADEARLRAALEASGLRFAPSLPAWPERAAKLVAGAGPDATSETPR